MLQTSAAGLRRQAKLRQQRARQMSFEARPAVCYCLKHDDRYQSRLEEDSYESAERFVMCRTRVTAAVCPAGTDTSTASIP
eukprot:scaffold1548_cov48-Prasinocladus_malaysianus.AAC.1